MITLSDRQWHYQKGYEEGKEVGREEIQKELHSLWQHYTNTSYQQGRADAIDEFVRINKECQPSDKCQNRECVDCIAEQLKEQNKDNCE